MLKRPKRNESEEDILRMQEEFLAEKAKNPNLQPAAKSMKLEKAPKKSLFAQSRERQRAEKSDASQQSDNTTEYIMNEINKKIVGNVGKHRQENKPNIILGDIVEDSYKFPKKPHSPPICETLGIDKVCKLPLNLSGAAPGKSIFALTMMANKGTSKGRTCSDDPNKDPSMDFEFKGNKSDLKQLYGCSSAIVEDEKTSIEVHNTNLNLLSQMSEEDILAERQRILNSADPGLVALLMSKRKIKDSIKSEPTRSVPNEIEYSTVNMQSLNSLPDSNPASEILRNSKSENWIHFDVIEKDKLEWMHGIQKQETKLKPGEKFEARFDWKGVLLPYSLENNFETTSGTIKDDRELYLHGNEPHRPGYTLQELFRLARSNVVQQRVAAFGAIAGILNIYNQGFYDNVLELPITKIFFLLRFGLDESTPAILEVVSKALALLFYNETDETLLDFIFDNPNCYWQPILQVDPNSANEDDSTSVGNLQKQMRQLQIGSSADRANLKVNVDESEEESKTSMSDFQLAETDLVDGLLRTNILQRIYSILEMERPENTAVSSCLKLLIRLGRSSKQTALLIANNDALIHCLFDNFLPGLERIDTMNRNAPMYNYPQPLCLKIFRVLISQDLGIAVKFSNFKLIDKLQTYLFCSDDIRDNIIKVQIESLRVLRCLLLLRVDNFLYRRFLPAFRQMLLWHNNHDVYETNISHLMRQHAAAILCAISSFTAGSGNTLEMSTALGEQLYNCCCKWFHQAKRQGIKDFSQATLLSSSLHTITCYIHHCGAIVNADTARFQLFFEKYLRELIKSDVFEKFISVLSRSSSVVLRHSNDRRNEHISLPNVGSVIMHQDGPQLVISQTYPVHLLNAVWRLLMFMEKNEELCCVKASLLDVIIQPKIIEPLVEFLRGVTKTMNIYLATNFFAKPELELIYKLLSFDGIAIYYEKAELFHIAYNFLCCLTAEHIPKIEHLLERYIFNNNYLNIDAETLNKWRMNFLESVHQHYIVLSPDALTLSVPHTQLPILPRDWPYSPLRQILQNYLENVQQMPETIFSERESLQMTFTFVAQLEICNPSLQIVTPTEKLMYFMIAFMGSESEFLDVTLRPLLMEQIQNFYTHCQGEMFKFDASYESKCKFENLYILFVDHFQAASYGDELFSSLVMVPLAQKYDNKWRKRVWSDYAAALRFLNCDEKWLIGGYKAYIEPPEEDRSLIRAYDMALKSSLLKVGSLPHRIATHHVRKFKEKLNEK